MSGEVRLKRLRVILYRSMPPLAVMASVTALILSPPAFLGSRFLSELSTTALFEAIWSVLSTLTVVVATKFPNQITRSVSWICGFGGFVVVVTIFIVPLFGTALSGPNPSANIHEVVAFALVILGWAIGLSWTFGAFALTVSAGDWRGTVWTTTHRRNRI